VVVCLVALVGIWAISISQDNPNDYAFAILVVLPLLLGWKLYGWSRL